VDIETLNKYAGLLTIIVIIISSVALSLQVKEYYDVYSVGLIIEEYTPPLEIYDRVDSTFVVINSGLAPSSYEINITGNGVEISKHRQEEDRSQEKQFRYSIGPKDKGSIPFSIWEISKEQQNVSFEIQAQDCKKGRDFYNKRFDYERNDVGVLKYTRSEDLPLEEHRKGLLLKIFVSAVVIVVTLFILNPTLKKRIWEKFFD
jgi:hypothetical protein